MGRVAKPALRSPANPDEIDNWAEHFNRAVDAFRELYPDDWEECRRWPTESGLAHIAAKLKA